MLHPSAGFPYYIELTAGREISELLSSREHTDLFSAISEEKSKYRYAEGKWSIKQILGHITDHERIMVYRALRFSRKDTTLLSSYDQDLLVDNARFDEVSFVELLLDYKCVRNATISFFKLLSDEQLKRKGMAWKFELTVEESLRTVIGHESHHIKVLKEKYGTE